MMQHIQDHSRYDMTYIISLNVLQFVSFGIAKRL